MKNILLRYIHTYYFYILLRQSVRVPRHSKLITLFQCHSNHYEIWSHRWKILFYELTTYDQLLYSKQVLNLTLDKVKELQMVYTNKSEITHICYQHVHGLLVVYRSFLKNICSSIILHPLPHRMLKHNR